MTLRLIALSVLALGTLARRSQTSAFRIIVPPVNPRSPCGFTRPVGVRGSRRTAPRPEVAGSRELWEHESANHVRSSEEG